jgi:transcriptional regulator with XRE-family HTH domain
MNGSSTAVAERLPHRVDIKVGEAIRARRKHLGYSQQHLAGALGISFQQVQKYERGSNRISASMLYKASTVLQAPIESFFEGVDDIEVLQRLDESYSERSIRTFMMTAEGVELAQAFPKIKSASFRRKVTELVRTLAGPPDLPSTGHRK